MRSILAIYLREMTGYVATPAAAVFMVVFLIAAGALTFQVGGFLQRGEADLAAFFAFHPWLHAVFAPAITMRMWAEEQRAGTRELILTLPIGVPEAVIGKFLAAWTVVLATLVLTGPMWWTVHYLGTPDHGTIAAGYAGSLLIAAVYLSIGSAASAATRSPIVAYIVGLTVSLALTVSGIPQLAGLLGGSLPAELVDTLVRFSIATQFDGLARGLVEMRSLAFFAVLTTLFLFLTIVSVSDGRRR